MSGLIEYGEHGRSMPAFVSKHLMQTLRDQIPRGVIRSRDEDGCVNGYCSECDMTLESASGEWTDELAAQAGIGLICEGCFQRVLSINNKTELLIFITPKILREGSQLY